MKQKSFINLTGTHLVPEKLIPSSIKDIFICTAGTLIFIFILNIGADLFLNRYTTNLGYRFIRQKWELLNNLESGADILILGDSSGGVGVVPELLESELNATVINLCTVGWLLVADDVWLLEEYIQKFGTPKNVIIIHVYDIWHRSVDNKFIACMSQIPREWGFWKSINLDLEMTQLGKIFIGRYFPLYAENRTLSKLFRFDWDEFELNRKLNKSGFTPIMENDPERVEIDYQNHINFLRENDFEISSTNKLALSRIKNLAQQYEFHVYFINGPLYEILIKDNYFQIYHKQVYQAFEGYCDSSEYLVSLLNEPVSFPKEKMQRVDHVIFEAAKEYTHRIGSALKKHVSQI